jgi:environmental stress-induced protein Ves
MIRGRSSLAALVLRHGNYRSMPWRNGAGTTLEIARWPAAGAEFSWRLSLASIAQSGPFSAYPGYARVVALVEGAGFTLYGAGIPEHQLLQVGALARFPGAAETHCTLLAGPCTDLSLMVREPGSIGAVSRAIVRDQSHLAPEPGALRGVFCLSGDIEFRLASGESDALERRDTLLYEEVGGPVSLRSTAENASVLAFAWRPAHDEANA